MSLPEFAPPYAAPSAVLTALRERGFALGAPSWVGELAGVSLESLKALAGEWEAMPSDPYLRDGGHYRRRRHASFIVDTSLARPGARFDAQAVQEVAHRAHFQSPEYNALHGGMQRWFEPIRPGLSGSPGWARLLIGLGQTFSALKPVDRWYVEAHQFRIDTSDGIGRPTPEGAHRDGVDFVALFLIAREHIRGGETRVFDAASPSGLRFTLKDPWSALLLDDERVIHESTPIQPLLSDSGEARQQAHRDTLVLTFRRHGFQEPG